MTGQAKYAEDFRVEGMLFCKLLLSPMPHARVRRIDTARALAVPGVKGILTADELPAPADIVTDLGQRIPANEQYNRNLRETWQRNSQEIARRNADRMRQSRMIIRPGAPTLVTSPETP